MKSHGLSGRHATSDSLPNSVLPTPKMHNVEPRLLTNGCNQGTDNHDNLQAPSQFKLFFWSSSDEGGLKRWVTAYKDYLCSPDHRPWMESDRFLNDLAYTLSRKRSMLPWKTYAITNSVPDLITKLSGTLPENRRSSSRGPKLGFAFTGQGAQWHAMGLELVSYAVYKTSMQRANDFFRTLQCQWSILGENPSE